MKKYALPVHNVPSNINAEGTLTNSDVLDYHNNSYTIITAILSPGPDMQLHIVYCESPQREEFSLSLQCCRPSSRAWSTF